MKEQSSTSKQKTKPALLDQYKEYKEHQAVETKKQKQTAEKNLANTEETKLPNPTGWRMLILPFKMGEKTKGGVVLADETIERSQVASTCGLVLRMGPYCYNKEKFPEGPWCKKGDWVIFARYAGSRILIDGGEVRLLNDDEILATIDNPEDIFHQY
jgi:co-chaperonin GroES (HSP10)|tara:strand:+ start:192 stop:662 length:471 start_codon:yes stop_codon:yes gene_type:complete